MNSVEGLSNICEAWASPKVETDTVIHQRGSYHRSGNGYSFKVGSHILTGLAASCQVIAGRHDWGVSTGYFRQQKHDTDLGGRSVLSEGTSAFRPPGAATTKKRNETLYFTRRGDGLWERCHSEIQGLSRLNNSSVWPSLTKKSPVLRSSVPWV